MHHARSAAKAAALAVALSNSTAAEAEVGLSINFLAQVSSFNPLKSPLYFIKPSVQFTGFTDPVHAHNCVTLTSGNGHFGFTDDPTCGLYQSSWFESFQSIFDAANDGIEWNVRVKDGDTRAVYNYSFTLDASRLTPSHLRPISFVGITPGDQISNNPTFTWTMDPSTEPGVDYTDAQGSFFGPSSTNIIDQFPASNTSWTPSLPLPENNFTSVDVRFQTTPAAPSFLIPSTPITSDGPTLDFFTFNNAYRSYAAVQHLTVIPAPASVACAWIVMFVSARRRRA